MAITITSEQIYRNGSVLTTPQVDGSIKFCYAGYGTTSKERHVTLYTCHTDEHLSQITFGIYQAGIVGTSSSTFLGIYVTPEQNSDYLTSSTGGDTKLRFNYTCTDDGTPTSGTSNWAVGTVTKTISAGTFYVYVVPYSGTSSNTTSTFYSNSAAANVKPTLTGVEVQGCVYIDNGSSWDAYQVYIDNGSSWDLYMPYIDNGSSWDLYS